MFPESGQAQDVRVEKLWKTLDVQGSGSLDIDSLRAGLQRLNHRAFLHLPTLDA